MTFGAIISTPTFPGMYQANGISKSRFFYSQDAYPVANIHFYSMQYFSKPGIIGHSCKMVTIVCESCIKARRHNPSSTSHSTYKMGFFHTHFHRANPLTRFWSTQSYIRHLAKVMPWSGTEMKWNWGWNQFLHLITSDLEVIKNWYSSFLLLIIDNASTNPSHN